MDFKGWNMDFMDFKGWNMDFMDWLEAAPRYRISK